MIKANDDRSAAVSLVGLVAMAFALACITHFSCGCYRDNDPNLPDCRSAPSACGGYPEASRDASAR